MTEALDWRRSLGFNVVFQTVFLSPLSVAISPNASSSAARKVGFWDWWEGREGKLSQGQLHLSSFSFSWGVSAQIKDYGRVNWSTPHATHHSLQRYYQKELWQLSFTFAEAAAPHSIALKNAVAKHIISKGHLPKTTGQKITYTQHSFRAKDYKVSRHSICQVSKFAENGGTEEICILEQ